MLIHNKSNVIDALDRSSLSPFCPHYIWWDRKAKNALSDSFAPRIVGSNQGLPNWVLLWDLDARNGKDVVFLLLPNKFQELWVLWLLDFACEWVVIILVSLKSYCSSSFHNAELQLRQVTSPPIEEWQPPDLSALPTIFLPWNTWGSFYFLGWTLTDTKIANHHGTSVELERKSFLQEAWTKQSPGVKDVYGWTRGHLIRVEDILGGSEN